MRWIADFSLIVIERLLHIKAIIHLTETVKNE